MLLSEYLSSIGPLLITLLIDVAIPTILWITTFRTQTRLKLGAPLITAIITILVGNGLLAYICRFISFISIENESQQNPVVISIVAFLTLTALEGIAFFLIRKYSSKALIKISMSPNDYKELILAAERNAKIIKLMPKRIHVMFKSPEFITFLAEQRFGPGSEYIQPYIDEHISRSSALLQALGHDLKMYEIHNKNELISYVQKRGHHGVSSIEKKHIIHMINEWKRIIGQYPDNYFVRLTEETIPLKYELIDDKKLVMHESVGTYSRDRFNAIFIESPSITQISDDFAQIWERVPANERSRENIIKWIDDNLLTVLQ